MSNYAWYVRHYHTSAFEGVEQGLDDIYSFQKPNCAKSKIICAKCGYKT